MTKFESDPIAPARRRLFDAQAHWHRALKGYFSPDDFRLSLNACIQELRNVTFVLQSNKRDIAGFDDWYLPWQEKMRSDERMRWLVQARNLVVKQGDLELHSFLRLSIVGSYLDDEVPRFRTALSPFVSAELIHQAVTKSGLPLKMIKQSYILIERKWIVNDLPNSELLSVMAYCWGFLASLLQSQLERSDPSDDRVATPPCMDADSVLTDWFRYSDGEIFPTKLQEKELVNLDLQMVKEKYHDAPMLSPGPTPTDLRGQCQQFFSQACYMLQKDGYHKHIAFLFRSGRPVRIAGLKTEDQADKFRVMHEMASEVRKMGCDAFIMISEAWVASLSAGAPYVPASQIPDRSEALVLIGIDSTGEGYTVSAQFTRKRDKIVLELPVWSGIEGLNIIQPILDVWHPGRR